VSTQPQASSTVGKRRRKSRSSGRNASESKAASGAESKRLSLIGVKVDEALRAEIDAYAEAKGITRSRAAGHYLAIASETLRGRAAIPAARADELLDSLEGVRTVVELLGPPTFGLLRLLSHWATQGGGLKVSEDELLAELRTVASDEWEQALSEAERELHDSLRKSRTEGAH
jgi:hypothetical protein